MRSQILFLTAMIATCVICGCIYPFSVRKEIKDDFVYVARYDKDQNISDSLYNYHEYYFAESKKALQGSRIGYRYDPMEPNRHYIFIGDSVEILLRIPIKPIIKTVKILGITYTRYRYLLIDPIDGPLDIYVRNKIIKFMRVKLFAEGRI